MENNHPKTDRGYCHKKFVIAEKKNSNKKNASYSSTKILVKCPSIAGKKPENKKQLLSSSSTKNGIFSRQMNDKFFPRLCIKPENIYMKELATKYKFIHSTRDRMNDQEKVCKLKHLEYACEMDRKMNTPVNIDKILKQKKIKMLDNIKNDINNPYSTRWINQMLNSSYGKKLYVAGFLNGVPKFDIIDNGNKFNNLNKNQETINRERKIKYTLIKLKKHNNNNTSRDNYSSKIKLKNIDIITPNNNASNSYWYSLNESKNKEASNDQNISYPEIYKHFNNENKK